MLMILILATSCAAQGPADPASASGNQPETGIYPEARLRLEADPKFALVKIGGEVAITVGEFNGRLQEFLIADTGQGVTGARRQFLDELITHKVIVREAKRIRDEARLPPVVDGHPYQIDRVLAQPLVKESVANPSLVLDDEARRYLSEHPSAFQHLQHADLSEQDRLISVKFAILSARFREKVLAWRSKQKVEIFESFLEN